MLRTKPDLVLKKIQDSQPDTTGLGLTETLLDVNFRGAGSTKISTKTLDVSYCQCATDICSDCKTLCFAYIADTDLL